MQNPRDTFRDRNHVLQLVEESPIKSKNVMTSSSQNKKKRAFFVTLILSNILVLSQNMVY